MPESIRILIVEDSEADAGLAERAVAKVVEACEFQRVETREAYLTALEKFQPDLIISDYNLPRFDGMTALKLALLHVPMTPVIIWTGSINEDTAVECMKAGANNYVLKDNIKRLAPALIHALEERKILAERKRAEEQLRKLYRAVEQSPTAVVITDLSGNIEYVNPMFTQTTGYSIEETLGKNPSILKTGHTTPEEYQKLWETITSGNVWQGEFLNKRKSGETFWESATIAPVFDDDGKITNFLAVKEDITERKEAEAEKREAELRYRALFEQSHDAIFILDLQGRQIAVNQRATSMLGYSLDEILGLSYRDISAEVQQSEQVLNKLLDGEHISSYERLFRRKNGETVPVEINLELVRDSHGNPLHIQSVVRDITQRKQSEKLIKLQLERLDALRAVDMAINASVDLGLTLNLLLGHVTSRLNVDAVSILLLKKQTLNLEYAAGRGFHTDAIQRNRVRVGESNAGRAVLERRTVHVQNLKEAGGKLAELLQQAGEQFWEYFGVPLIAKGQVMGVMEIFHRLPLNPDPEWLTFMETLAGQAAIAIDNAQLFEGLQHSNLELTLAYDETIVGWSRAMDLRDQETEGHTQRVTETTLKLADMIGINQAEQVHIRRGALLHDIGKLGVPDEILFKPGKLTDEEWQIMKQHPQFAYEMLKPISYLRRSLDIPYCHHEKWNGAGYPRGLKEKEIPLAARIFAVVDVWDALRSDRPYRPAWNEGQVWEYIRSQSGEHFDPQIVEVFMQLLGTR